MATNVEARPQYERRHHERRRDWSPAFLRRGMSVSWGGIWSGVLVALGVLLLMTALGLAIGISAVDPGDTGAGTIGTGAGIWGAVSLLVALFVGGMTATRVGVVTDRTTGFFEGSLVWVIAMLLMAYAAGSGAGMLARGAFGLVGGTAQALGGVAQQQIGNIDTSGTVEQIAAQLRDPAVAEQVASVTGLSMSEVQSTLQATANRVEANADDPAQAAQEAQRGLTSLMQRAQMGQQLEQGAESIQPQAATAAWITFFALALSLGAAVAGAFLGRRNVDRKTRETVPAT